jgi:uncharacterized protein with HEPN domain
MSPRKWLQRIEDILSCIRNIQTFTKGMTLAGFEENPMAVRAVAFELVTMGEAARAVPAEVQQRFPEVPWDKMQLIRNVVVHEYFRIDEQIIWKTCQEDLPPLVPLLENMLNSERQAGEGPIDS